MAHQPLQSPSVSLRAVACAAGALAACIGGVILAQWLFGPTPDSTPAITMKANCGLALLLSSAAVLLLAVADPGPLRRRLARLLAFITLLIGILTLAEHITHWNLGLDQLLAHEPPGMLATTSPNRMGPLASLCFTLAGAALLLSSARRRPAASQYFALLICALALLPTIGYLYGATQLFGLAHFTAISRPAALGLLLLGVAILALHPHEALMAHVTARSPGGQILRRLLPALLLVVILLGWFKILGERQEFYEPELGSALRTLLSIALIAALVYYSARRLTQAEISRQHAEQQFRREKAAADELLHVLDLADILIRDPDDRITRWTAGCQRLYGFTPEEALGRLSHDLLQTRFPEPLESIRATLHQTGRWEGRLLHRRKDGHILTVSSIWVLHRDPAGRPSAILQVENDITPLQSAQQDIQSLAEFPRENPAPVLRVTDDAILLYANRPGAALLRDLGWCPGEVVPACFHAPVAEALATSGPIEREINCGTDRIIAITLVAMPNRGYVNVYGRDVTAIRRTEAQLRENEARLRATFENAGVGILEVDTHDHFTGANDRLCQMLGYTREEILRLTVHDLTYPNDRASSDQLNAQVHDGTAPRASYEKRYLKRDGTPLWVHVTVSAVRDSAGRYLRGVGVIEDISQRKAARDQLRLQAAALEAAANGIAITDFRGTILWANHAFCAMTGYTNEELLGRNPRILKSGLQDESFYRDLWKTIHQGRVWHGELVNRRKDGSLYTEEMTITPLFDAGGGRYFIAIKQDVTRRKQAEDELVIAKAAAERARAAAEEANRAKDHFLAVLSHELRTPLTAVLPALDALVARTASPEDAEYLEMARRNVALEARLIDDLLDVTRIARGKIALERKPVDLAAIIRQAVDVCRPDIESRRLHFGLQLEDARHLVHADPARLQQVFWNLLKNAIKFTPHGGCIGLRAWRVDDHAVIQVVDSGAGIEPAALSRIFNAFEQEQRSTTRQFGGLGLGLAISKSLVEMHGGSIYAHSAGKGQGATFTVELPLLVPAAVNGSPMNLPADVPPSPPRRSLRILLVEDHGDTARIMSRLLEIAGHRVFHAGDVATALQTAAAEPLDLLISDLGLPDGSGHDLMAQLTARGLRLPAIALSGYGMAADVEKSRHAGFREHLTKPVNFESLENAIARASAPSPTTAPPPSAAR